MSQMTFRRLLDDIIRAAIESGLDAADVHGEMASAGMCLDDQRRYIDMEDDELVDLREELSEPPY